jgi:hypothetical protein
MVVIAGVLVLHRVHARKMNPFPSRTALNVNGHCEINKTLQAAFDITSLGRNTDMAVPRR